MCCAFSCFCTSPFHPFYLLLLPCMHFAVVAACVVRLLYFYCRLHHLFPILVKRNYLICICDGVMLFVLAYCFFCMFLYLSVWPFWALCSMTNSDFFLPHSNFRFPTYDIYIADENVKKTGEGGTTESRNREQNTLFVIINKFPIAE